MTPKWNAMMWSPGAPIFLSWSPGAPHILGRSPGALNPFGTLQNTSQSYGLSTWLQDRSRKDKVMSNNSI